MKKASIILSILAACLCCACEQGESKVPAIATEVTIRGLEEGKWVYFSIKDGETVGTSTFLSEEEDKAWAERTDWDFAICGDYIKTNSGTSGHGKGGILRDETHNFQTLKEAPAEGYLIDSEGIVK